MSNPKKPFEVELRALVLNKQAAMELRRFCEHKGSFLGADKRLLIDYSTFLEGVENRTKDIRIRSTNGKLEIITKLGSFDAASRQEAGVFLDQATDLRQLLTVMAFMGFEKGVAAIRHIHRYQVGEAEVALQEVRRYDNPSEIDSYFVEVEVMATKNTQQAAERKVRALLAQMDVKPFSSKEWYDYIERLNREANGIFEYQTAQWETLAALDV